MAATVARDNAYDERLARVLARLRDLSKRHGLADAVARYDAELRAVKARITAAGKRVA
jgi:hypothetical protein